MSSPLSILILVNWAEDGNWHFTKSLSPNVRRVDVLQPVSFSSIMVLKNASTYLSEFYTPLMALFRKSRYDVVISWQMRIGVCYGILKRIFHRRRPPVHIIQDFHIDLTRTDMSYRLHIAMLKFAIPGIDLFCCTSTEEEEIYSRMFDIERNRIVFLPLVESPDTFAEPAYPPQDYIFAYGKSDRDFDTLVRAAGALNIQTYILCKNYEPKVPLPENVTIIRTYVSFKEVLQWIGSSRMVVLPLKDYRVSAGQLSMLEVMAMARPLIVTENMATREYAAHGQTALFFQAGNDAELAERIKYLWDHTEAAERIGQQARLSAAKMHDRRMDVIGKLLQQCTADLQKGESR